MHAAMSRGVNTPDIASFAIHDDQIADPVLGRLVERGLHDELAGTAYAVVDGVDGRTPPLRFSDIDLTRDARPDIGRASVRARVGQEVETAVVPGPIKKQTTHRTTTT